MTDRVSATMKWLGVGVLLVAIVGAIWYLQRGKASTSAATEPEPPKPAPIAKVTKLSSVEERKLLADRIEKARTQRALATNKANASGATAMATRAPAPPRLPEQGSAISAIEIRSAMRDVIPVLADCYSAALPTLPTPHVEITAELTLTGDPDIGTVIDAKQIADKTGQPLPAGFDDCLRSTFQTLALPPLAEGDQIEVRYPFVFDNQ